MAELRRREAACTCRPGAYFAQFRCATRMGEESYLTSPMGRAHPSGSDSFSHRSCIPYVLLHLCCLFKTDTAHHVLPLQRASAATQMRVAHIGAKDDSAGHCITQHGPTHAQTNGRRPHHDGYLLSMQRSHDGQEPASRESRQHTTLQEPIKTLASRAGAPHGSRLRGGMDSSG